MGDECLTEGCDRTPVRQGLCKHHFAPMVRVPAEKIAALREALATNDDLLFEEAARAVADTVETEDEPLCRCGHDKASHEYEYSSVKGHCSHGGTNGVPECRCARYTPAHMAAPDELTALREEIKVNDEYHDHDIETGVQWMRERDEARAERDALRERIRALADEWEDLDHKDHCWDCDRGSDLRKLLGDA